MPQTSSPLDRARRAFEKAVGRAQHQIQERGTIGWRKSATEVLISVPGRPRHVYITRTDQTVHIARNDANVPQSAFYPVRMVLQGNTYVITGRDVTDESALVNLPDDEYGVPSHPLSSHSDVTITAAAEGEVLTRSGGAWVNAAPSGAVDSVNGQTGAVVLDADDIDDAATTHKFASAAELTKLGGIEAGADVTDAANIAAAIIAQDGKTTPVDTDIFPGLDSADSYQIKEFSWANLKATLKTYFDTLYVTASTLLGYALLAGRSGGQVLKGGTGSGDDLTLESTNHATKGDVFIQPNGGNVEIGGTTTQGYKLGVQGTSSDIAAFEVDSTFARMLFTAFRDNAFTHGLFKSQAARGSKASPSAVQSGDSLFAMRAEGYSTAFGIGNNAEIAFEADGPATGTSLPGRIVIRTTPSGSTFVVDAVWIDSMQRTGLGIAPTTRLGLKAGNSTNDAAVGGVLYVSTTQAGNVGVGEDDLASYSIPANTLATNGQSIWFEASGGSGGSGGTIRVRFGATVLVALSVVAPRAWYVRGRIFRAGATTQKAQAIGSISANNALDRTTPAETLSGAVTIKVTGEGSSNNDLVIDSFIVGFDDANT